MGKFVGLDNYTNCEEVGIMEKIFHPVSGESGYFTTEQEKVLIDAIIQDYNNQLVVTSANGRGVVDE